MVLTTLGCKNDKSFIIKFMIITCFLTFSFTLPGYKKVEANSDTRLVLLPEEINLPYLELGVASKHLEITLRIENIQELKEYHVEFFYDPEILEWYGGKINRSFYLAVGGTTGSVLNHRYPGSYTGSIDAYTYCFEILKPGNTTIRLINTELRDTSDDLISHTTTECNVTVLNLDEWINGEYEILYNNYTLLSNDYDELMISNLELQQNYVNMSDNYDELSEDYETLNSYYEKSIMDYSSLNTSYTILQSNFNIMESLFDDLQESYNRLEDSFNEIQDNYNSINYDYDSLEQLYDDLATEHNSVKNVTYILGIATVSLIIITVYLYLRSQRN